MPPLKDDIRWFKGQFKTKIEAGIRGTPFTVDLMTAIAVQETRYIWSSLYKRLPVAEVLKLCVGDTIDAPGRSAFPKNKAQLLRAPNGDKMFDIAREALEAVAQYNASYRREARNPDKFCRGFGIFQYDLQFFKTTPDYFLEKRWYDFDECLGMCIGELKDVLKRRPRFNKSTLSDEELVYVAIAYNTGSVNVAKKFKQGYLNRESGKYYGEYIWDYLQTSKSVT
ncbi:MAG TPA: hypothetical protein VF527_02235 [Pyrinomonadaceae bacterium]|jgi:hypothetical protein